MGAKNDGDTDPDVFIRCVMAAVGATSPSQFIDLLGREGVLRPTQARDFYRWKAGTGPNFQATMRLLRRAGFLTPDALACLDAD